MLGQPELGSLEIGSLLAIQDAMGHACVLQACEEAGPLPEHVVEDGQEALEGLPAVQDTLRVWVPPPQATEHDPHAPVLHEAAPQLAQLAQACVVPTTPAPVQDCDVAGGEVVQGQAARSGLLQVLVRPCVQLAAQAPDGVDVQVFGQLEQLEQACVVPTTPAPVQPVPTEPSLFSQVWAWQVAVLAPQAAAQPLHPVQTQLGQACVLQACVVTPTGPGLLVAFA